MRGSILKHCWPGILILALCYIIGLPNLHGLSNPPQTGKEKTTKGKSTTGKTKHKYTNRLAKETSPYLLMHAHNPTDWYPWGPEAFAKAKKEGKLVFLSIGYSSCYWCHVMERESFNNPAVAKILNKWFVCIKVDREERPDIDQIYMTALNQLGKRGGWPLSMFLLPDGRPFYGGTYWPPYDKKVDGGIFRGFTTYLKEIHKIHTKKPKELEKYAEALASATRKELSSVKIALVEPNRKLVDETLEELETAFDKTYGGFGSPTRNFRGPKFPTPCRLDFLLHEMEGTKSKYFAMVTHTLDKMARGGIYDHLGGGFHRYTVERTWTVPHFEKMLYDNGQLLEVYAKAYRRTKSPLYKRVLTETVDYLKREMLSPEGAIYSSQDAETDEEEGRSYVWTNKELQEALPNKKDLQFFRTVYGAGDEYNFEKKYHILHLPNSLGDTAKKMGITVKQLHQRLQPLKEKLFRIRSKREHPFKNKIALTAWSGLAIAGLAEAGKALEREDYIALAKKSANFVLAKQKTAAGRLLRRYGAPPGEKPKAAVPGYLEDYACLVHGLLTLHAVTGEKRWLQEAQTLTNVMIDDHADKKAGGFYFTAHKHEKLFARSKDQYDGAISSGNSLAARNLVRLWIKTGNKRYRKEAEDSFQTFAFNMKQYPSGMVTMAHALSLYLDAKKNPPKENDGEPKSTKGKLKFPRLGGLNPKGSGNRKHPVKVKITAGKINDKGVQTIQAAITVEKGWNIYANPVGNDDLAGADTILKVRSVPSKAVKVVYPKGKTKIDTKIGAYSIYKGKVTITAHVNRSDRKPIEVSVRYQACDANTCLLPKTVTKKIE